MNSCYSNRIEGQGTHPLSIERALGTDFSTRPDIARRQRIAVAHIRAEQQLEAAVPTGIGTESHALQSSFLRRAHSVFYQQLEVADRITEDGRVVEPGQLRQEDVAVGRHQPPTAPSVPAFLARMDEVYPKTKGLDSLLVGIAAAHHRAAWVHPCGDGNGRACRLQTHCALQPTSAGLWSVNRGLARQRDAYYTMLANADSAHRGDLDGRGNLSDRMLSEWCGFFLLIADDQVNFMTQMLNLGELQERIAALVCVRTESMRYKHYSPNAILPLHHVLLAVPISRGDFVQMTGMPERSARRLFGQLIKDQLLVSESANGPVVFNFPLDMLPILLPNLYPEAAMVNMEE